MYVVWCELAKAFHNGTERLFRCVACMSCLTWIAMNAFVIKRSLMQQVCKTPDDMGIFLTLIN